RRCGYVLAEHIDHVIERFHAIEGGPPLVGAGRSMRRFAPERVIHHLDCRPRTHVYRILGGGVPIQHDVDTIKKAIAYEVYLTAATLCGRRAEHLDGALVSGFAEPRFDGHGSGYRSCAKHIMPAR